MDAYTSNMRYPPQPSSQQCYFPLRARCRGAAARARRRCHPFCRTCLATRAAWCLRYRRERVGAGPTWLTRRTRATLLGTVDLEFSISHSMSCNVREKKLNHLAPEVEFLVSGGKGAGFADRRPFCFVEPPEFRGGNIVGGRHAAASQKKEGKFHTVLR